MWRVFIGIVTAFTIITSIIMLVDFVETSRDIGSDGQMSMLTLLLITMLNAPRLVEETIPFVVLFGVMGTLFSLNKKSELVVMRASGLSAWRLLSPAICLIGLLGIIWAMLFNPLAAVSAKKYDSLIQSKIGAEIKLSSTKKDIWLREGDEDGQLVIHARSANNTNHRLYDVVFYYFDFDETHQPVFTSRYDAKEAELRKENYWVLLDVVENKRGASPQHFKTITETTQISWETLRARTQTNNSPPFWKIRSEIAKARQAGFSARSLTMQFHKLLALPITLIAMTIIAAGASMSMTRNGGALRLLIISATLGFGVYFADNIISAFGENGTLPPILASWVVPIMTLFLGLAYLSKREDG
jgi:lipopolysaccharide export system permease protein